MKRILVPTDFSDNANNALNYAVDIANHFGAQITLIHAYLFSPKAGMLLSVERYIRQDAEREMAYLADFVKEKLFGKATVENKVIKGYTADIIKHAAKQLDVDLIVMGTQGASGLKEVFIGSIANSVVGSCPAPTLVVPSLYEHCPIERVGLVLDEFEYTSKEILKPMLTLAKGFGAEVQVLHIERSAEPVGVSKEMSSYLNDIQHKFIEYNNVNNINEGINEFVGNTGIDMLCMVKRDRGFLNNLFHQSITKKEVFHSPVPLLVLHDIPS